MERDSVFSILSKILFCPIWVHRNNNWICCCSGSTPYVCMYVCMCVCIQISRYEFLYCVDIMRYVPDGVGATHKSYKFRTQDSASVRLRARSKFFRETMETFLMSDRYILLCALSAQKQRRASLTRRNMLSNLS
jgi:hypothetical protein